MTKERSANAMLRRLFQAVIKIAAFNLRGLRSQIRFPFVRIGFGTMLDKTCQFEGQNEVGEMTSLSRVSVGRFSYIGSFSRISDASIGRYCSIANSVRIGLYEHPTRNYVSSYPTFHMRWKLTPSLTNFVPFEVIKQTEIGHDVWIGENAIVKSGVRVGTGAIIGAGAVVTKDVPPYAIVAGVPARLVRFRFDESLRERILKTEWWNWSPDRIRQMQNSFSGASKFLEDIHE